MDVVLPMVPTALPESPPDPFSEPTGWWRTFWNWLPLIVGLIVFELTVNPMLGVALACYRFGEKDFATAVWIYRRDPVSSRGRACGWFHLSWGFAKIGIMSFLATGLAIILILTVDAAFQVKAVGLLPQVQGAILTAMAAIVGFLITSYLALAAAMIGRVKVWASPSNHRAREARRWPPVPEVLPRPEANRVMVVMALSGILTFFAPILGSFFLIRNHNGFLNLAAAATVLGLIGNLGFLINLGPRLAARSPAECWSEAAIPVSSTLP